VTLLHWLAVTDVSSNVSRRSVTSRHVTSCRRSSFRYIRHSGSPEVPFSPRSVRGPSGHSCTVFSDNIGPPPTPQYHSTNVSQSSSFKLLFIRRISGLGMGTFKHGSVAWNFVGGGGPWAEENFDIVFLCEVMSVNCCQNVDIPTHSLTHSIQHSPS
jgi:hypothetical protein